MEKEDYYINFHGDTQVSEAENTISVIYSKNIITFFQMKEVEKYCPKFCDWIQFWHHSNVISMYAVI